MKEQRLVDNLRTLAEDYRCAEIAVILKMPYSKVYRVCKAHQIPLLKRPWVGANSRGVTTEEMMAAAEGVKALRQKRAQRAEYLKSLLMEGLSIEQAARVAGISVPAFKSCLYREGISAVAVRGKKPKRLRTAPMKLRAVQQTIIKMIEGVDYNSPGGCWNWMARLRRGTLMPVISFQGKDEVAHRVFWHYLVGPIPEGMRVWRTCRNNFCMNPAHMQCGTDAEFWHWKGSGT